MPLSLPLPDEAATLALGARLAQWAAPPCALLLRGDLGAGKTTLARGFIRAWTEDPAAEAPSPTYTLVQIYDGPAGEAWHLDLYRLKGPEEAAELIDPDAARSAVLLIEWPERLGAAAPQPALDIRLEFAETGRMAVIEGLERWQGAAREF